MRLSETIELSYITWSLFTKTEGFFHLDCTMKATESLNSLRFSFYNGPKISLKRYIVSLHAKKEVFTDMLSNVAGYALFIFWSSIPIMEILNSSSNELDKLIGNKLYLIPFFDIYDLFKRCTRDLI